MSARSLPAAALFLFTAAAVRAAPHIDSIAPSQGPIAGGTAVTITGSGFIGATVTLDEKPMTPASISDTQFQLAMPARDNGYALIQISAGGESVAAEFLYVPPKLADLPPGYITTVAGVGLYDRFYLPAITANIDVVAITTDAVGNIYGGSPLTHRVLRVRTDGILEPFAGSGLPVFPGGSAGDGLPAPEASITFCRSVSLDAAGNAYIADSSNRIRRVDGKTGIITTIAGTGEAGFSGDGGAAKDAQIDQPNFVAAAPDGTVYFIDFGNARIRRIGTDGTISTVAGNGIPGYSGDGGAAMLAQIGTELFQYDQDGLALDPRGILYLAETLAGHVRRIDLATGIISTFLPRPGQGSLERPRGISVDPSGNLLVGSLGRIARHGADGSLRDSWGDGTLGFSPDGTSIAAMRVSRPTGTAIDSKGGILFADSAASRIRRINLASGLLETVAGIGPDVLGVPGPAVGASLAGEYGDIMFLPSGVLLVTDDSSHRIFAVDRAGAISTYGGTGLNGLPPGPGDGRHISAVNVTPVALASDGASGFFMTDTGGVWYVDPNGLTRAITRPYEYGFSGDGGPATEASLAQPWDIALDSAANVVIADTNNNRIRRIDGATGVISTVAGSGPTNGFEGYGGGSDCGDEGPALAACLNTPYAIAVDPEGNIFVNDSFNHRLRKIDTSGIIHAFSDLDAVGKPFADANGGLFVHASNRVMRVLPDGSWWVVAGTGGTGRGFGGDGGPASAATIRSGGATAGIDADAEGNLFFHDSSNRRIRAIRFGAVLSPPDPIASRTGGSPQSAPIRSIFSSPLELTVKASWGAPAPGVRVDFAGPPSGATCVFNNGTTSVSVLTDRDGKASAVCRANCFSGSYTVTATPLASGKSVSFSLKNLAASEVHALPQDSDLQSRGEAPGPCGSIAPVPAPIPAPIGGRQ